MKIGIYGGTFDPPHLGHKRLLSSFINEVDTDIVFVIPAFIPPHKAITSSTLPEQRFEMAKLAFSDISEKITISDLELRREGKSYTSDTVSFFRTEYETIYLLCGTDMFLTLEEWHDFEYIFNNCIIVCGARDDSSESYKDIRKKKNEYEKKYQARIKLLKSTPVNISSSEIRDLSTGIEKNKKFIPEKVLEYIVKNSLYKTENKND